MARGVHRRQNVTSTVTHTTRHELVFKEAILTADDPFNISVDFVHVRLDGTTHCVIRRGFHIARFGDRGGAGKNPVVEVVDFVLGHTTIFTGFNITKASRHDNELLQGHAVTPSLNKSNTPVTGWGRVLVEDQLVQMLHKE
ncbi:hypothetical protein D3C86_1557420 [compost metagenome]